jgi:serine phosphatase RsbU (regulator of sigma subunit)
MDLASLLAYRAITALRLGTAPLHQLSRRLPFGTLGLLGGIVLLAVAGLLVQLAESRSLNEIESVESNRAAIATILREQLDEETGVRGYAASWRKPLLQPYLEARKVLPGALVRARKAMEGLRLHAAAAALADAAKVNRQWVQHIARPIVARHSNRPIRELIGKRLTDRFRADLRAVDHTLARRHAAIAAQTRRSIRLAELLAVAAVLILLLIGAASVIQQYVLRRRLEDQSLQVDAHEDRVRQLQAAYVAERRISDSLQEAFIPQAMPDVAGLGLNANYTPAEEDRLVGGDWYDVVQLADGRVLVILGDVAGHGIQAAVAMNRARRALLLSSIVTPDPGAILERANVELVREATPIITAVAATIDPVTHSVCYALAGHPPPLLVTATGDSQWFEVGSLPLGFIDEVSFQTREITCPGSSMLVLYTDGIIEHSRNLVDGENLLKDVAEQVRKDRVKDPAAAIHEQIFATRSVRDDAAIVVAHFERRQDSRARGSQRLRQTRISASPAVFARNSLFGGGSAA